MKFSKWMLASFASVMLLSACTPSVSNDSELMQQSDDEEVETTHIPSMQLSNEYYKTLIPYKESVTRGLVVSNVNTKYDIKEVEKGLMRISQNEFSTKDYFFQEGQYIGKSTVENWLARPNQTNPKDGDDEQGLNPSSVDEETSEPLEPIERAEKAPIYLSHVVEQNYLKKVGDNKIGLGGISIGLALNSIYYYQREQYGEYYERPIEDEELVAEGEKIAQEIIERLRIRKELQDVKIVVGLFKQQPKNAIIPGSYMQYAVSEPGKNTLGDWKKIDEHYASFPMSQPEDKYRDMNKSFLDFKQDIDQYFANFTSVIGTGFYKNNRIQSFEIDIPIQFFGTAEIIGFTQYLTGVILNRLPKDINISVNVTSINGPEALIIKKPNDEEPFVHIYD